MSSPSSPNRWPAVLLLLAAIGIPSVAGLTFAHTITQNPWLAVGLGLLYEVGILIVGITSKVWQQLESDWVKQIAEWVNVRMQGVVSGYQRRYCEYLQYEHRDFDVKGLTTQGIYTLDLEQVFVELSIAPRAAHQTTSNPIQIPEALRHGGHSIWDYLASASLMNQHLMIIGAAGSGKTTLLKHIALTLVSRRRHQLQSSIPYKLPFLLFLRDHANALIETPTYSLGDAVQGHLRKWGHPIPPGWVERQLTQGHCIVLLDGLDEVADLESRRKMANWVQQQMIAYGKNRFIITSRPFGYRSNPLSRVTLLEVNHFTVDQIKQFVYNWYIANEIMSSRRNDPGVQMRAKEGAEDLFQRLRNTPALFALAANPLLLTMIATVHRYRSSLPGKRVALYAEICEVFLGKRQEARGLNLELSPAQKQAVLQPLAYYMMCKEMRDITLSEAHSVIQEPLVRVSPHMSPKMFLQMIENISGLLLERENDYYGFAHLTFQEYLAATHIRENKLEQVLLAQIESGWWQETIRLYCAQADATSLIAACLTGSPPSLQALLLALECQKEAKELQPAVSKRLDSLLDQGVKNTDSERQWIVAEALLNRRLQQMAYIDEETYVDTSLITCAEYQIFLDEERAQGIDRQPDHWSTTYFPSGQAGSPVLGVRLSDAVAFCAWLTARESGIWRYRLPKAGSEYKLSRALENTIYWVDDGTKGTRLRETLSSEMIVREVQKQITSRGTSPYKLIGVRTLVSDLIRDLARDLVQLNNRLFDLGRNLDYILDHGSNFAVTLKVASHFTLARDLSRSLNHVLSSVRTLNSTRAPGSRFEGKTLPEFLDESTNFLVETLAGHFTYWLQEQPSSQNRNERRQLDEMVYEIMDIHFEVYITFEVLRERIQGVLPVREGILIVKERKKEKSA